LNDVLSGNNDIILSAEAVLLQLEKSELSSMMAYIRARFDRVRFHVYLRPLASLVSSQFQQRVQFGLGEFVLPPPRYRKLMTRLFQVAQDDPVTTRLYDRASLVNGDIVDDFRSSIGFNAVGCQPRRTNDSLSAETISVLYAFNKYCGSNLLTHERFKLRADMISRLSKRGGHRFGFSLDLIKRHIEAHADEVIWIKEKTGLDLAAIDREVDHPIACEQDLFDRAAEWSTQLVP
jgi:hypothetical protein